VVNTELVDSDRWGIPAQMFGAVGDDFYGIVGRIVLVAALLEDRLHVLFCALANAPQDRLAGDAGTRLIRECRERLDNFPGERRDEVTAPLTGAETALLRRHEVIHSLWPFTGQSEVRGWRNVPRAVDSALIDRWSGRPSTPLPDLLHDLIDLVDRCRRVEQWVPPVVP